MKQVPEKEIPAVGAAGSNKLKSTIALISNNATPRQPWRARIPFKYLPISKQLLASQLFKEAKQ